MAELKPFGWIFTPHMKSMNEVEISRREIVLCRYCKHWDDLSDLGSDRQAPFERLSDLGSDSRPALEDSGMMGRGWCGCHMKCTVPNYFCADGKRKGDKNDEGL